jgi:hypothetical protein
VKLANVFVREPAIMDVPAAFSVALASVTFRVADGPFATEPVAIVVKGDSVLIRSPSMIDVPELTSVKFANVCDTEPL